MATPGVGVAVEALPEPGLEQPDLEDLPRVVPFVDRVADVDALVALQPDELGVERGGQHLRDLRLADAGLTFEEQRPPQPKREIHRHRQAASAT